jgi:flagellar FliJ protein
VKKFVFSLQKVLDLREFQEKQAETELAKAIAETDRIKLALIENGQKQAYTNKTRNDTSLIDQMKAIESYVNRLKKEAEDLLNDLAATELVVEEKREIMVEAMKTRKVLSKLKEKQLFQYKKEQQKAEDSAVDDIVTGHWNHSDSE